VSGTAGAGVALAAGAIVAMLAMLAMLAANSPAARFPGDDPATAAVGVLRGVGLGAIAGVGAEAAEALAEPGFEALAIAGAAAVDPAPGVDVRAGIVGSAKLSSPDVKAAITAGVGVVARMSIAG
jgi:hypothetical protein